MQQYGKLKDELANNYLLDSDQYPDTGDKALWILGNYQVSGTRSPDVAAKPRAFTEVNEKDIN
jgi:hypothetical protein